eukprot:CAMPEP_0183726798 /NCGR_PEP_ID=MMETSP0737-20130205/24225_1 /TAXON_ID=385413 /ORGANISM="Thalassiosira miniscula, Strain CCMP1093" /LENGTH=552 /DNA_ID=CAMNT_0025958255 /DNA_START=285 /DNA_END=1943 /DNA_ORIENTATION=+
MHQLILLFVMGNSLLPTPATAERPDISSCDDLPGYCHKRTAKDMEFVDWWNKNVGPASSKGKANGKPFHVRRKLPEVTVPPTYVPFSPGEYETVEGILLAFDGSSSGGSTYDLDVVAGIAAGVTRPEGAKVFMVANANQRPVAETAFINAGVNMAKVEWIEETIDAVWIRDYGPRFICDPVNDTRAAVDTRYYSSRPNDDNLPVELGKLDRLPTFGHDNHDLNSQIMHSGGNGHFFSSNKAFATRLLDDDNSGLSEQDLKDFWFDYHGAELHFFDQLSFSVDGTGHIDMWFLPLDDSTVIIGEWENEDNYGSKTITDGAAQYMESQGYTVFRTPNWNSNGGGPFGGATHFTYTNAVIANDVVIISKFNVEPEDSTAYDVFQAAFPGKTIVQVDSSSIITRSGALHCIAQHVYDCSASDPNTAPPTLPPVPPAPQEPIAVANANPQSLTATPGEVTLDGTGSFDPDGTIVSYEWTQSDGSVVLTSVIGTVTVDTLPATYTLTVVDNNAQTGTDSVEITLESDPTCVASGGNCAGNGKVCCTGTCSATPPKRCP